MLLTTVFSLAAAINAALLAAALALRAWPKRARTGIYAAAFLLVAAAAVALIALDHAELIGRPRLAALIEGALTLAAGPLLLLFTTSLVGVRLSVPILFAPAAVFVIAAAFIPDWAQRAYFAERLVLVQMAFTVAAALVVLHNRPLGRRAAAARRIALMSVGALGVLHLAQIARMLWPDSEVILNIVPIVGGAAFLAATGAVYFGGRTTALDPLVAVISPALEEARRLADELDAALRAGLLRDPDLNLVQAAAAVAAAPEHVSGAVEAARGLTFTEHVQRLRVDEAKRLLADPGEARTSMEAIGLLAGFGSRSAFYKAFREIAGMTPASYRAARAEKVVQREKFGH